MKLKEVQRLTTEQYREFQHRKDKLNGNIFQMLYFWGALGNAIYFLMLKRPLLHVIFLCISLICLLIFAGMTIWGAYKFHLWQKKIQRKIRK